ncbi:hypothetical protein AB0B30_27940 [Streptomyces narbonensis]|uniref:Uncharacterized protein n=1 Tax=Streptomyces narbonensis TaxID=67333 RepID=A0ABV3CDV6_9ACTN
MPEDEMASEAEPKQPKKKAAKKVAGLRPRPDLLSNPALSGAASVAARSVLGQGAGAQPVMGAQQSAPAAQGPVVLPAPSSPPDFQGTDQQLTADATTEPLVELPADERSDSLATPNGSEPDVESGELASAASKQPDVEPAPGSDGPTSASAARSVEPATSPKQTEQAQERLVSEEDPQDHLDTGDVEQLGEGGDEPGEGDTSPDASPPEEKPSPGSRRKRAASPRQGSKLGPAHTALLSSWRGSRVDLKLRRDAWETHPFRFAADLMTQLSKRVAQDCSSSGKSLTAAQYVDAAMTMYLPSTIEEQLALAEEFLLSRETDVGTGKQGSHRVSPEVYAIAAPLANELRKAGHARIAVHVYSGALDNFLRDLESEGPLGK